MNICHHSAVNSQNGLPTGSGSRSIDVAVLSEEAAVSMNCVSTQSKGANICHHSAVNSQNKLPTGSASGALPTDVSGSSKDTAVSKS